MPLNRDRQILVVLEIMFSTWLIFPARCHSYTSIARCVVAWTICPEARRLHRLVLEEWVLHLEDGHRDYSDCGCSGCCCSWWFGCIWGYRDVRQIKEQAQDRPVSTIKREMFNACAGVCKGCGKKKYYEDFEIDHIRPKEDPTIRSKLLCGHCLRLPSQNVAP